MIIKQLSIILAHTQLIMELLNGSKLLLTKFKKLIFESWESFLVNKLTYHKSFHDMILSFWKDCIIPNAKTDKDAENVYYKFYTHEDENKFWVVGIHVEKIESMWMVA